MLAKRGSQPKLLRPSTSLTAMKFAVRDNLDLIDPPPAGRDQADLRHRIGT